MMVTQIAQTEKMAEERPRDSSACGSEEMSDGLPSSACAIPSFTLSLVLLSQ